MILLSIPKFKCRRWKVLTPCRSLQTRDLGRKCCRHHSKCLISEAVAVVATSELAQVNELQAACWFLNVQFVSFCSFARLCTLLCQENHIMIDGISNQDAHQAPWKKSIQASQIGVLGHEFGICKGIFTVEDGF